MTQKIISNHKTIAPGDADWSPIATKTVTRAVQVLNAFTVQGTGVPQSGQAGDYIVQVAYTQCEVIVIACYVLFLGSYAVDIHHMVRHDTLRLGGPHAAPLADHVAANVGAVADLADRRPAPRRLAGEVR